MAMSFKTKRYIGSATKLALFTAREIQLTHDEYEVLVDDMLQLLEDSKDEAFRLRGNDLTADAGDAPEGHE